MSADPVLRSLLFRIVKAESIKCVVETGTFLGLGSTTMLAEAFPTNAPPHRFVTLEANRQRWEKARDNLTRFPFVTPVWGLSVPLEEALAFLAADECLSDHRRWPDVWIDDVVDPLAFYSAELRGQLGGVSKQDVASGYQGEDLLRLELRASAGLPVFIVLDSAGGVGFLEFSILLRELRDRPYIILLDDIDHIKHFRSAQIVHDDPRFTILGSDVDRGWMLAQYHPRL